MDIGILLAARDPDEYAALFPDDGVKFEKLISKADPDFTFTIYDMIDSKMPADVSAHEGYIITGSPAGAYDDYPWIHQLMDFIRLGHGKKIPFFGVCFGHQAIAHALGGRVEKSQKGWRFGVFPTYYTDHAHWMEPKRDTLDLVSFHQDQVLELPEGAELLGGDQFCPIGSFKIGTHIFTVQHHPEYSLPIIHFWMKALKGNLLPDDVIENAGKSLGHGHEGDVVAEWAAKFFKASAA